MLLEIGPEIEQLVFQIRRGPEQHAIQILTSNRADQPFHKGMGQGNIGDGFDLGHLQYPLSADWLATAQADKGDRGRS